MTRANAFWPAASILALVMTGCGTGGRIDPPSAPLTSDLTAGGIYKVGTPYKVFDQWFYPQEDWGYDETGIASWYGPKFQGRRTANGELFDMNALTAAHPTLPMPTLVRVTNLENGRSLVLRLNDRGPFKKGRLIDVSRQAARELGFYRRGTARVRVEMVGRAPVGGRTAVAWGESAPASTTRGGSAVPAIDQARGFGAPAVAKPETSDTDDKGGPLSAEPGTTVALRMAGVEDTLPPEDLAPETGRTQTARTLEIPPRGEDLRVPETLDEVPVPPPGRVIGEQTNETVVPRDEAIRADEFADLEAMLEETLDGPPAGAPALPLPEPVVPSVTNTSPQPERRGDPVRREPGGQTAPPFGVPIDLDDREPQRRQFAGEVRTPRPQAESLAPDEVDIADDTVAEIRPARAGTNRRVEETEVGSTLGDIDVIAVEIDETRIPRDVEDTPAPEPGRRQTVPDEDLEPEVIENIDRLRELRPLPIDDEDEQSDPYARNTSAETEQIARALAREEGIQRERLERTTRQPLPEPTSGRRRAARAEIEPLDRAPPPRFEPAIPVPDAVDVRDEDEDFSVPEPRREARAEPRDNTPSRPTGRPVLRRPTFDRRGDSLIQRPLPPDPRRFERREEDEDGSDSRDGGFRLALPSIRPTGPVGGGPEDDGSPSEPEIRETSAFRAEPQPDPQPVRTARETRPLQLDPPRRDPVRREAPAPRRDTSREEDLRPAIPSSTVEDRTPQPGRVARAQPAPDLRTEPAPASIGRAPAIDESVLVQVGSYILERNAKEVIREIRPIVGRSAAIRIDVLEQTPRSFHRVRIGPLARGDAEQLTQRLVELGYRSTSILDEKT